MVLLRNDYLKPFGFYALCAVMDGFKINYIFSKDMRLGKYTSEHRNLGQAEGAHKVGASERCSQNPAARIRGP